MRAQHTYAEAKSLRYALCLALLGLSRGTFVTAIGIIIVVVITEVFQVVIRQDNVAVTGDVSRTKHVAVGASVLGANREGMSRRIASAFRTTKVLAVDLRVIGCVAFEAVEALQG